MNAAPRFFEILFNTRLRLNSAPARSISADHVSLHEPGLLKIGCTGGTVWTPVISNLAGILIVEKSIGVAMSQCGLQGLDEMYPVVLREDWPDVLHLKKLSQAPNYVWFRLRRDIRVDPQFTNWPASEPVKSIGVPYRRVPLPDTHGGADVFGISAVKWVSLYCTRRFLEAARNHKWKWFIFKVMDVPYPQENLGFVVYLGKKWPPERWYPEGVVGHRNNLEPA